jgi:hypothetical protein
MPNQESRYGCSPCLNAVEIIKRAYQNAPEGSTKRQALDQVYQTIDKVRQGLGCTKCPVTRGAK